VISRLGTKRGRTGASDLAMNAYQKAIENEYRFYSYGDAMLIV
jgi:S-adenosylmethionine:tRNA-ribosyltransferase-isomerase (queuine synthetase)